MSSWFRDCDPKKPSPESRKRPGTYTEFMSEAQLQSQKKAAVPLTAKRARERELLSERQRKMSRGTGRIDSFFREGVYEDEHGRRGKRPVRSEITPIAPRPIHREPAAKPEPADESSASGLKLSIGCCNDPMCVKTLHNHEKDWTYLGRSFVGHKPVEKQTVPDPYTVHSFPRHRDVVATNTRNDIRLTNMTFEKRDPCAMLVQLARAYHTEDRNLAATRELLEDEHRETYRPKLRHARATAQENPALLEEIQLAAQTSLQQAELVIPAARRVLESTIRARVGEMLDHCAVELPAGVPRSVVVEEFMDIVRLYAQDCNEEAIYRAGVMVLLNNRGAELDALKLSVGGIGVRNTDSSASTPSASGRGALKSRGVTTTDFRFCLLFPCESQWLLSDKAPACASIAVSACEHFLRAPEAAQRNGVTTDQLLGRDTAWAGVVRGGVAWYDKWRKTSSTGKTETYQLVKEAVESDATRHAKLCRDSRFDELFGNLVTPTDLDEGFDTPKTFVEFLDGLRETEAYKADKPIACAFSSARYTLAFARLPGGVWWLFDSHGKDRSEKSTLGRFQRTELLVAYVEHFFGVRRAKVDLTQERRDIQEESLATMVAFNAFMFYRK